MLPVHVVECPLCFKNFSSNHIENHVQHCTGKQNSADRKKEEIKRKCSSPQESSKLPKRSSPWSKCISQKKSQISTDSRTLNFKDEKDEGIVVADKTSKAVGNKSMATACKPLAEVARPRTLDDYVGQSEVLGEGTSLHIMLKRNTVPSMILWGPPGCGKTTLAHIIACNAKHTDSNMKFVKLSATSSGKADVQAVIKVAINDQKMFQRKTILFVDEIHRFNKLQQDTFLPHVENGTIILIGATTENPSFALNSALLSRCRVIILNKLSVANVKTLLVRAVKTCIPNSVITGDNKLCNADQQDENSNDNDWKLKAVTKIDDRALEMLANLCDGDARTALNGLQLAVQTVQAGKQSEVDVNLVKSSLQRSHILYDRAGDQHYEMISALHKSIRGGDDNAALYWLTRMILGGEDPKYIARRLIRIASEDIGLADANALNLAVSAYHSVLYVGLPECDASLAQCAVYLARAPKSPEVYLALEKAKRCIQEHVGPIPGVPLHLRNASTKLMKQLGYGAGYSYKPNDKQTYLPDEMQHLNFFVND